MSEAKITRAATAAVRRQSRPIPDAREMKAQRYARTSRAGTHLGTGCHTWTKSPLRRPKAPSQIRIAAKRAWPALATRIALPSPLLELLRAWPMPRLLPPKEPDLHRQLGDGYSAA